MAAQDDEVVPLNSFRIDAVDVRREGEVYRKLLEPVKEFFRYFLQAQHVKIEVPDELDRPLKLAVAEEYVPRVDFHFIVCERPPSPQR